MSGLGKAIRDLSLRGEVTLTLAAVFTGSVIVAEFDSLEDAQAWADADPYRTAGVYAHVVVKPFKMVYPK